MGLETGGSERKVYLNIFNGKFVVRSDENDAQAVSRTNKNGSTVWERHYDKMTNCILESAKIVQVENMGAQIKLAVVSDGELYEIGFSVDSKYGSSFLWKASFIDVSKKFDITPYSFTDKEGKNMTGFNILQDGVKVATTFAEGEVPTGVKKGNEALGYKWDFSDRTNFLVEKFLPWAKSIQEIDQSVRNKIAGTAARASGAIHHEEDEHDYTNVPVSPPASSTGGKTRQDIINQSKANIPSPDDFDGMPF